RITVSWWMYRFCRSLRSHHACCVIPAARSTSSTRMRLRTSGLIFSALRSLVRVVTVCLHGFMGDGDAVLAQGLEKRVDRDRCVPQVSEYGVGVGWLQCQPLIECSRGWSECCEFV